jgi:hypothetical protein
MPANFTTLPHFSVSPASGAEWVRVFLGALLGALPTLGRVV